MKNKIEKLEVQNCKVETDFTPMLIALTSAVQEIVKSSSEEQIAKIKELVSELTERPMSRKQVADYLNRSEQQVGRYVRHGGLKENAGQIYMSDLKKWLSENPTVEKYFRKRKNTKKPIYHAENMF